MPSLAHGRRQRFRAQGRGVALAALAAAGALDPLLLRPLQLVAAPALRGLGPDARACRQPVQTTRHCLVHLAVAREADWHHVSPVLLCGFSWWLVLTWRRLVTIWTGWSVTSE